MPELKQKERIFERWQYDPHHLLGLHSLNASKKVIRLYRPGAKIVHIEVFGKNVEAKKTALEGFFEYEVPAITTFTDYRIYHQNGSLAHDPYAFEPSFGELDAYLFERGVHYRLYQVMGARVCTHQGIKGIKCAVWAPSAKG